jgi:hypothetical protein
MHRVATRKERKKQIISLETCTERTISQCNFVLCSFPPAIIKVRKQKSIPAWGIFITKHTKIFLLKDL